MKGFGNLVKEAQKLQTQLEALKEEVGKKKVEASAGGGRPLLVTAAAGKGHPPPAMRRRLWRTGLIPYVSCWQTRCLFKS